MASGACGPLLYVAPERLDTPRLQELVRRVPVGLVAVDEAHCVSEWGQDFRPSYLGISAFIEGLPVRPTVAALTATATDDVRRDIAQALDLHDPFTLVSGFDRTNLYFGVERPEPRDKQRTLLRLVGARASRERDRGGAASRRDGHRRTAPPATPWRRSATYCSTKALRPRDTMRA